MSEAPIKPRGRLPSVLAGLLLGAAALGLAFWLSDRPESEVEEYFPRATPEAIEAWTKEWHTRGDAWSEVPDPAGTGPVETARYWLARDRYDMEVRRRGDRFVVSVAGVAEHEFGGGWAAYGEGRIVGASSGFAGATATFTWSCLGLRYRHASDGVGRIVFDPDGEGCHAIYMAWEAPEIWAKSYGERHGPKDEPPAYGAIKGQIPVSQHLATLPDGARYAVKARVVSTEGQAIAGALVQIKGHPGTRAVTDDEGRCTVSFLGNQARWAQALAAGATGYLNGETVALTGDAWPGLVKDGVAAEEMLIELRPLVVRDASSYAWQRASGSPDPDDAMACGTCHPWHYDQWYGSRHARMADSGMVTWERARMTQTDPSAPDDCTACHQPAFAAKDPNATWKPRDDRAGNHCDFCHKIQAVLDPRQSGVFGAYRLARPGPKGRVRPGGIHHVFGSAPDVTYAYMGASYNPIFATGHVCAGCHQGGGRWRKGAPPKLDTFEEWKRWAAARPAGDAKTCLDCHMPGAVTASTDDRLIDQMAWDALHRSPKAVHDHRFLGADPQLGALALSVDIRKSRNESVGSWDIDVTVTNVGAGHKVPTGTWSKHVVIGVWAESEGKPLVQTGGERVNLGAPAPEGSALAPGDWRNPGGLLLGMQLKDLAGQGRELPTWWSAWRGKDLVDTRLAPGAQGKVWCRFQSPNAKEPTVEVRIIHRRGWLPHGTASTPWTVGPQDPQPEVLWKVVRK